MNRLWPKKITADREMWTALLLKQGIRPEENLDATYGMFEGETLIATGSRFQNILKCIAVDPAYQGGAVFNELLSELINEVYRQGYDRCYLYTKPASKTAFSYLGFREIESVEDKLCFMERATRGFDDFLQTLREETLSAEEGRKKSGADDSLAEGFAEDRPTVEKSRDDRTVAAIVMNANPFTKGHLALVEKAYAESDVLHIFVLSEDLSAFPQSVRKRLVIEGTAHLPHVFVHDTEGYMVSAATFPSYFLKEDDDVTSIQATLDAKIFKFHIAPALDIDTRFVGDEPFSRATNLYNEAMEKVFADAPNPNVPKLVIIPRVASHGRAISATDVRRKFVEGDLEGLRDLVPNSTYQFLLSDEGMALKEHLLQHPELVEKASDTAK